jgi:hypothetical protein
MPGIGIINYRQNQACFQISIKGYARRKSSPVWPLRQGKVYP